MSPKSVYIPPRQHRAEMPPARYSLDLMAQDLAARQSGELGSYQPTTEPAGPSIFDEMMRERNPLERDPEQAFQQMYGPISDSEIPTFTPLLGFAISPKALIFKRQLGPAAETAQPMPAIEAAQQTGADETVLEHARRLSKPAAAFVAGRRAALETATTNIPTETHKPEAMLTTSQVQPLQEVQSLQQRKLPDDYPASADDLRRLRRAIEATPLPEQYITPSPIDWFGGASQQSQQPTQS